MSEVSANWREENGALVGEFHFEYYVPGASFVLRIAEMAQFLNHHPEITLSYKKVKVVTTTHEAGNKVTGKDKDLAAKVDELYVELASKGA